MSINVPGTIKYHIPIFNEWIIITFRIGGSDGKESAWNVGDPGSTVGQEDPLEKEMAEEPDGL